MLPGKNKRQGAGAAGWGAGGAIPRERGSSGDADGSRVSLLGKKKTAVEQKCTAAVFDY